VFDQLFAEPSMTERRLSALRCLDPRLDVYLERLGCLAPGEIAIDADLEQLHSLEQRASLLADEDAVVDRTRRFTYAELDRAATGIAELLQARGIDPTHRVGVELASNFSTVAALVAVLKCGAATVPIDANEALAQRRAVADEANVRLVITQSDAHYESPALPLDLL
jgi:non-ribosomal peptide synthetase component F